MIAIIKDKLGNGLIATLPEKTCAFVSVITRIELLSYPKLTVQEELSVQGI
jgi:hypothetical protein